METKGGPTEELGPFMPARLGGSTAEETVGRGKAPVHSSNNNKNTLQLIHCHFMNALLSKVQWNLLKMKCTRLSEAR